MFDCEEYEDFYTKTKIIGVGDFGAKIVNYLKTKTLFNVDFAVVAGNEIDDKIVADVDLLFIFTDLSDENISMQLAEMSKYILTVAVIPESAKKVEKFQNAVDVFITIEDENIASMYNVVRCVNGLIEPGLVGLDFYDIKFNLENGGRGYVAYGRASGKTPITDAMNTAINSMEDILLKSKHILCCIFGCIESISMMEDNESTTILQEVANPDAEIVWKVIADDADADKTNLDCAEVIIIATGLEQ